MPNAGFHGFCGFFSLVGSGSVDGDGWMLMKWGIVIARTARIV